MPAWTAPASDWLPSKFVTFRFLALALLAFPVVLLVSATLRPRAWWDPAGPAHSFGIHIISIHWPIFLGVTFLVVHLFGKVSFRDMGLRREQLASALIWTAIAWVLLQVIVAMGQVLASGEWAMSSTWGEPRSSQEEIFSFLANTLGTGLNEEVFFRGFVFVQLLGFFSGRMAPGIAFSVAVVASALLFALAHLQVSLTPLAFLSIGGVIAALLYARTGNLFLSMGLHGLFNAPMVILSVDETFAKVAVLIIVALIALAWPAIVTRAEVLRQID